LADRKPPHSPVQVASTNAVLQLLGGGIDDCIALLVALRSDGMAEIEDAFPASALAGERIRLPDGLLTDHPVSIETKALRLSVRWTELCGHRPPHLAAVPVPNRSLHIVTASFAAHPADLARITTAADLTGQLLKIGQMTGRERDASLRVTALIAHLPAPVVFVDSRNIEVLLNDRARALLGIAPDEDQASAIAIALQRFIADAPLPARQQVLSTTPTGNLMFEVSAGPRRFQVESRWIDQDDLSGRIWLFRDVTAEKAFQAKLLDMAALHELTVENVNEAVLLIDRHERISLWNEAYIDLFDIPAYLVDRGADLLPLIRMMAERGDYGPGAPEEIAAAVAESIRKRPQRQGERKYANGRIIAAEWIPLPDGRMMFSARDVTTERNAARFKEELISTVSHELRTPLTAIAGSLGLLKAGVVGEIGEKALSLIDVAHKNSDRLTRLVNDLLDTDKLQSGTLHFRFVPTDMRKLLEEGVEQMLPYALKFGVAIDLEMPEAPINADVDPDRLLQVMSNLLSNAAKFSPEGSRVRVLLASSARSLRISVIDQGRGMSAEFRRRMFSRFAQEDRSSERGQVGTGLGLAISKSIVDNHRGQIAVETHPGRGTTFHIDLPLVQRGL